MTTTETKLRARGDRYRNRALKLLRNARRWRDQVREASDYLTAGWERAVKDADAADERADRAEAALATARARVAALESGAGQLRAALELQVKYPLVVRDIKVADFIADFVYDERGEIVVEDFKSEPTKTPVYRLKKKLMRAIHGIDIRETS